MVLKGETEGQDRIAFVMYYKGEYEFIRSSSRNHSTRSHRQISGRPARLSTSSRRSPCTFVPANDRKKGRFEKMFLAGRPPVSIGVTSNGDVFGGTQLTISDVLGDKQFNFYVSSIAQDPDDDGGVHQPGAPAPVGGPGLHRDAVLLRSAGGVFYDPTLAPFISRNDAIATRTIQGGTIIGVVPARP